MSYQTFITTAALSVALPLSLAPQIQYICLYFAQKTGLDKQPKKNVLTLSLNPIAVVVTETFWFHCWHIGQKNCFLSLLAESSGIYKIR